MPVAGNTATVRRSAPLVTYEWVVTGLTAGAKNSLVLGPVPPDFVPNRCDVVPLGASLGSVCHDPSSVTFLKDSTDSTRVLVDIYPTTVTVARVTIS